LIIFLIASFATTVPPANKDWGNCCRRMWG